MLRPLIDSLPQDITVSLLLTQPVLCKLIQLEAYDAADILIRRVRALTPAGCLAISVLLSPHTPLGSACPLVISG